MRDRVVKQASWQEPVIFELDIADGQGTIVTDPRPDVEAHAKNLLNDLPVTMVRDAPPRLPTIPEPQVVRHFLRLSQETLGTDLGVDIGLGTCTMKYAPKVGEELARSNKVRRVHPRQPEETLQGVLAVMHGLEQLLCAISGFAGFTFQPGGGTHGIFTNARIIRAYHDHRGDCGRNEMITTLLSHPANAAAARSAGFRILTIPPGPTGLPDISELKAVLSSSTAGCVITNPEDTGIYNPDIGEFTRLIHEAGGLCAYDHANANALLGVAQAASAGFDLCQFNLHKTFGSPHGAAGLAVGACGVRADLAPFLPVPTVKLEGSSYTLEYSRPESIGRVRSFFGNVPTLVRAYAWLRSLGAEGLRTVAETAALNTSYVASRLRDVEGLSVSFPQNDARRVDQVRFSWADLAEETGVGTMDIARRTADFGTAHYYTSHHPWVVPEPMTLEPTESYTRDELDAYVEMLCAIADEARRDPDRVRSAPTNAAVTLIDGVPLDNPDRWVPTWRVRCALHAESPSKEETGE